MGEVEHSFTCPYCWSAVSMVFDLSVEAQTYIEDCEVCCHPIQVSYVACEGEIAEFHAEAVQA